MSPTDTFTLFAKVNCAVLLTPIYLVSLSDCRSRDLSLDRSCEVRSGFDHAEDLRRRRVDARRNGAPDQV